jgi:hypothetical protein
MQHLEGNGTPVLYIGRTVLKGYYSVFLYPSFVIHSLRYYGFHFRFYYVDSRREGRDLGTGLSMLCLFRIMEFGVTVYILKVISCVSEVIVLEGCCLRENYVM